MKTIVWNDKKVFEDTKHFHAQKGLNHKDIKEV
jgi:hypothetical protein